jgi:hypothetical protein
MSPRKRGKSKTSLMAYVQRALRHLLALPTLTFNILFRPKWIGSNVIEHDNPEAALRALKYYSEMFALTFLIWVAANKFQLYEGNSEWRSLVDLAIQVPVAIAMILSYVLPYRRGYRF